MNLREEFDNDRPDWITFEDGQVVLRLDFDRARRFTRAAYTEKSTYATTIHEQTPEEWGQGWDEYRFWGQVALALVGGTQLALEAQVGQGLT